MESSMDTGTDAVSKLSRIHVCFTLHTVPRQFDNRCVAVHCMHEQSGHCAVHTHHQLCTLETVISEIQ